MSRRTRLPKEMEKDVKAALGLGKPWYYNAIKYREEKMSLWDLEHPRKRKQRGKRYGNKK